jgi:hypothetical protein
MVLSAVATTSVSSATISELNAVSASTQARAVLVFAVMSPPGRFIRPLSRHRRRAELSEQFRAAPVSSR